MNETRYALKESAWEAIILDQKYNQTLFFLGAGTYGVTNDTRQLADRVVKYLNENEMGFIPYPFNRDK